MLRYARKAIVAGMTGAVLIAGGMTIGPTVASAGPITGSENYPLYVPKDIKKDPKKPKKWNYGQTPVAFVKADGTYLMDTPKAQNRKVRVEGRLEREGGYVFVLNSKKKPAKMNGEKAASLDGKRTSKTWFLVMEDDSSSYGWVNEVYLLDKTKKA